MSQRDVFGYSVASCIDCIYFICTMNVTLSRLMN